MTKRLRMPEWDDLEPLNGAVIVQLLPPQSSKTFHVYTTDRFVPYVKQQLEAVRRLDIVFDIYKTDSLKAATRERRGVGTRRKISLDTQIPGNWQSFLRDDKKKEELFGIIAQQVPGIQVEGRAVYCTSGEAVISSCEFMRIRALLT